MNRDGVNTVVAYCHKCRKAELHIQQENGKFVCKVCLSRATYSYEVKK